MRGVKAEWMTDGKLPHGLRGTESYLVTKTRGSLTLDDIVESIKERGMEGYVCVVLKIMQDGYIGWGDGQDPKGDCVIATVIDEGCVCPVCQQMTPLITYCPECGKRIDTLGGE